MSILLVDEDWSKADPVGLYGVGYRGVIGYVSEDATGKNLTRVDVDAAHAAGLAVGLVYEYATQAALGGASRGARDGGIAVAHARALTTPAGVCLYAAVDWNATAAQMPAVLAYALADQAVKAAAEYRAGIYASYAVCRYLAQHGYTGLLWQTYAWSDGAWWPGVAVRQTQNGIHLAGATVDRDEAQAPDWGQWEADMALATDPDGVWMFPRIEDIHSLNDTVKDTRSPEHGKPVPVVQLLKRLDAGLASLLAAPTALSDAQVQAQADRIATALVASNANGLTTADHAGVVEDVKAALRAGTD